MIPNNTKIFPMSVTKEIAYDQSEKLGADLYKLFAHHPWDYYGLGMRRSHVFTITARNKAYCAFSKIISLYDEHCTDKPKLTDSTITVVYFNYDGLHYRFKVGCKERKNKDPLYFIVMENPHFRSVAQWCISKTNMCTEEFFRAAVQSSIEFGRAPLVIHEEELIIPHENTSYRIWQAIGDSKDEYFLFADYTWKVPSLNEPPFGNNYINPQDIYKSGVYHFITEGPYIGHEVTSKMMVFPEWEIWYPMHGGNIE